MNIIHNDHDGTGAAASHKLDELILTKLTAEQHCSNKMEILF